LDRRTSIARNGDQTKPSTTAASSIFTGSGQPPWRRGGNPAAAGATPVGLEPAGFGPVGAAVAASSG
jgi:hypothetical protein